MAIGGVLAADPTYGLGLRDNAGGVAGVIWPFGYFARRDDAGTVLFNRGGRALAREGDTVQVAGWIDFRNGVAHPCAWPELEVTTPAAGSSLATPGS